MEIFGYHPDLKDWTEIGNSGMYSAYLFPCVIDRMSQTPRLTAGIFRPEMLAPMGLPPDVKVIAWGLSLERYIVALLCQPQLRMFSLPLLSYDFFFTPGPP